MHPAPHHPADTPSWSTDHAAAPTPDAVHLATAWDAATEKNIRTATAKSFFRPTTIATDALAVMFIVLLIALYTALDQLFPGRFMATFLLIALLLALCTLLYFLLRRDPEHFGSPAFANASNPTARLRVVGHAKHLRKFSAAPFFLNAPFEPGIFRITYALESAAARTTKTIGLAIAGMVIVGLAEYLLIPSWTRPRAPWFAAGLTIGAFSRPFLWPTYLRIVPGRLDILQYRFLGLGKPRRRSFDLRAARLAIHLGASFSVVPQGSDTGEMLPPAETAWSGHNFRFERLLISAAVSPFPAPPLPEDELLG